MIHNRVGTTETHSDGREAPESNRSYAVPAQPGHREAAVGLFVLLGIAAILLVLFTLTDVSYLRGRYIVSTQVQNAAGLRNGDPVQMRGVNIGRVREFLMVPGGVQVVLELDGEYEIPADSRILLQSAGLLGGTIAEVLPGSSGEVLKRGDELPGSTGTDAIGVAEQLGTRADTVLTRVQALLSERTVGAVEASATELQTLLAEMTSLASEQRRELSALERSLRRSAADVERAVDGPELERAVSRVDSITAQLGVTTASLGRASNSLESLLGGIERGEGTLGRLANDDSLYLNLNQAAANLNLLVTDIRENPRRYLTVRVF